MTYRPSTLKEMLGALYDLAAFHGTEDDFTTDQRNTIRRLYNEVDPYGKIDKRLEEAKHANR